MQLMRDGKRDGRCAREIEGGRERERERGREGGEREATAAEQANPRMPSWRENLLMVEAGCSPSPLTPPIEVNSLLFTVTAGTAA